jgi:molybdate transport system substrate-binding protein
MNISKHNYLFLLNKLLYALTIYGLLAASMAVAQNKPSVTVFAAASVKDALDALAQRFEAQSGSKLVVSYAATSALARQIEKGAPADVFISADLDWMDYVEQRKLIRAGSRVNLLSNRLVLIAPADSKTSLVIVPNFALASALSDGRLAMADPDSVPAGKYGKAALEALGVWSGVAPKVARAENVRAALLLVARGEAPFGIVYSTDAVAERQVRVVGTFAANLHPPIVYPAAILAESKSTAAEPLMRFLRSNDARTVWQKFGFTVTE